MVAAQPAPLAHPGCRVHGRRHRGAAHQPPQGLPLQVPDTFHPLTIDHVDHLISSLSGCQQQCAPLQKSHPSLGLSHIVVSSVTKYNQIFATQKLRCHAPMHTNCGLTCCCTCAGRACTSTYACQRPRNCSGTLSALLAPRLQTALLCSSVTVVRCCTPSTMNCAEMSMITPMQAANNEHQLFTTSRGRQRLLNKYLLTREL